MEINMTSDVTHQLSSTSPSRRPPAVATTTAADPVLDQYQQIRSMISSFLGAGQDPTPSPRQSFWNYLHSEIEHLEEWDLKWDCETSLWNTVQGRRMQETGHNKSTGHHMSTSRNKTGHSRTWYHTGYLTSLCTSCAAFSDSHNTACYSDCQSTAIIKAFISVSTASIFLSCGWTVAWDFQTNDVYFEPIKDS